MLVIFILFNGFRWFVVNQEKNELIDDTISYLSDKGYNIQEDIEEITVVNLGQDEVIFSTVVRFKDEPNASYFYIYKQGTNQIIQIDAIYKGTNQSLKHQEN